MHAVRKAVSKIGEDLFPLYLEVHEADTLAQSMFKRKEKLDHIRIVRDRFSEIQRLHQCISLKTLAVNGKDLMAAGYPKGKEIGALLQLLLEHVLEQPEDNQKEILLQLLPELKKE